jgi:ABC-2 type transport system permease protein
MKLLEWLKAEWMAFKAVAQWTFSRTLYRDWYLASLPFEVANLLLGLATWYYYGVALGRGQAPWLGGYGSFAAYLLVGVAANSLLSYALASFVRATIAAFVWTMQSGAARLSFVDYFAMAGIPLHRWLVAKVLLDMLEPLLYTLAYIAGGVLLLGVDLPANANVTGALAALVLGVMALMGVSMIGAGLLLAVRIPYSRDPITWLVGLLAGVAAGVYFPPEVLPEPLRTASRLLPQTYTLRAMRACLLAGKSLGELGPDLVALAAGAVVLPLAGALVFKLGLNFFEKKGALY